jgi:hypothetical protein
LRNATAAVAPLGIGQRSRIENGIMVRRINYWRKDSWFD